MQDNIYAVPESNLDTTDDLPVSREFYVVSKLKFFILFYSTLGLYGFYWNYKNWKQYKVANNESLWPVPRAIFSIFFTHSLYGIIDMRVAEKDSSYKWSSNLWATLVVISLIADNVAGRADGDGLLSNLFIFANLIARGFCVFQAQKAINLACGDVTGQSNCRFTALNFLWIFIIPLLFVIVFVTALITAVANN